MNILQVMNMIKDVCDKEGISERILSDVTKGLTYAVDFKSLMTDSEKQTVLERMMNRIKNMNQREMNDLIQCYSVFPILDIEYSSTVPEMLYLETMFRKSFDSIEYSGDFITCIDKEGGTHSVNRDIFNEYKKLNPIKIARRK